MMLGKPGHGQLFLTDGQLYLKIVTKRRYHDAFDYDGSDRNLRYAFDSTAIRLRRIMHACFHSTRFVASKKLTCQFFVVVAS